MKFVKKYMFLALVLVAAVFPVLRGIGYNNGDIEVILILVLLISISAVITLIFNKSEKAERILLSFSVYWIIDSFLPGQSLSTTAGIFGGMICYNLLNSSYSNNFRASLLTFCIVWIIGCFNLPRNLILSEVNETPEQTLEYQKSLDEISLRPIIHIILDEQISMVVEPSTIKNGHPSSKIEDQYKSRGFAIYKNVTSSSSQTAISISHMFGFSESKNSEPLINSAFEHKIIDNKYFKNLASVGYEISAIAPNHINVCHGLKIKYCAYYQTDRGNGLTRFTSQNIERMVMALLTLDRSFGQNRSVYNVMAYRIFKKIFEIIGIGPEYRSVPFSNPVLTLEVIDQIKNDLNSLKLGDARFYHLLLPHFPYVLSPDCKLNPYEKWAAPNRYASRPKNRQHIYDAYWDQSACTHKIIFQLIDSIKLEHKEKNPIILIHGDHGSRIDGISSIGDGREMRETFFAYYNQEHLGNSEDEIKPYRLPELFKAKLDEMILKNNFE